MGSSGSTNIAIRNNTPHTWYCDVGESDLEKLALRMSKIENLLDAIIDIEPEDLATVVDRYLKNKNHVKLPWGADFQWTKSKPSWATCVKVDIMNSYTNTVRVQRLVMRPTTVNFALDGWYAKDGSLETFIVNIGQPLGPVLRNGSETEAPPLLDGDKTEVASERSPQPQPEEEDY